MSHLEIRVEPVLGALTPLRRSLGTWLERRGIHDPFRANVILATHEAVANAIQHAGPNRQITVRGNASADAVTIEVSDNGQWRIPDSPSSEERGRGLDLIRSLVTVADIQTGHDGTTVRLVQLRA
jgi:serine/threonine-protein kinase RsbW